MTVKGYWTLSYSLWDVENESVKVPNEKIDDASLENIASKIKEGFTEGDFLITAHEKEASNADTIT